MSTSFAQSEFARFGSVVQRLNRCLMARRRAVPARVKFAGIGADANRLGVNRVTLYRALTGKWKLPGLLARYKALKRSGARKSGTPKKETEVA